VALILAIGAGYVVGRINGPGIGAFINDATSGTADVPQILGATLWAGVLGLALNALLLVIERRLLPWHRASLDPGSSAGAGWPGEHSSDEPDSLDMARDAKAAA
jgi:NitT/TauT family transport system permease protein